MQLRARQRSVAGAYASAARGVKFLYQLAEDGAWKCRACHDLAYHKSQSHGTSEAFEQFSIGLDSSNSNWKQDLFPDLVQNAMSEVHALWQNDVAPYDLARIDDSRRAELLRFFKDEEAIREAFDYRRWCWSSKMNEIDRRYGQQIMQQLRTMWNAQHRSTRKKAV